MTSLFPLLQTPIHLVFLHQVTTSFKLTSTRLNYHARPTHTIHTHIIPLVHPRPSLHPLGLQGGLADQVIPLQRPVQQLPHQALLHLQHSYHSSECPCLQPLHHFTGALFIAVAAIAATVAAAAIAATVAAAAIAATAIAAAIAATVAATVAGVA